MSFSTFTVLGSHHLCIVSKHFHLPQKVTPIFIEESFPILFSFHPLATTSLFLVSMDFPILSILYGWNQIICLLPFDCWLLLLSACWLCLAWNLISSIPYYSHFSSATLSSVHLQNIRVLRVLPLTSFSCYRFILRVLICCCDFNYQYTVVTLKSFCKDLYVPLSGGYFHLEILQASHIQHSQHWISGGLPWFLVSELILFPKLPKKLVHSL